MQSQAASLSFAGNSAFAKLTPTGFTGKEAISSCYKFHVFGFCCDADFNFETLLHQPVALKIQFRGTRFFHGYVSHINSNVWDNLPNRKFHLVLRPQFWFLKQVKSCEVFHHVCVPDLIHKWVKRYHLLHVNFSYLRQTYRTYPFIICHNQSLLYFCLHWLQKANINFYFQHSYHRHELILFDSTEVLPNIAKPLKCSETWVNTDNLFDVNYFENISTQEVKLNAFNPLNDSKAQTKAIDSHKNPSFVWRCYQVHRFLDNAELQKNAQRILDNKTCDTKLYKAKSLNLELQPARRLKVLSEHLSGDLLTKCMIHKAYDNRYIQSHPAPSLRHNHFYQNKLTLVPSKKTFAKKNSYPIKAYGYHYGIVVGDKPDTVFTDNHGRIKIIFCWDKKLKTHTYLDLSQSGIWIPILHTQSGKHYQQEFIPRVGQKVVIVFMQNDINTPLCLGACYTQENPRPYPCANNPYVSGLKLKTQASDNPKSFHAIRFNDTSQNMGLYLEAQTQFEESIAQDNHWLVNHELKETVGGDKSVQVDDTITLEAEKKILLKTVDSEILIESNKVVLKAHQIHLD